MKTAEPKPCSDGRLAAAEAKRCRASEQPAAKSAQSREKAATISNWLAAGNLILSLAFFIFMYKYLPLLAATELKKIDPALGGRIVFNLIDGGIRLLLFLLFIWGVSLWKIFAASTSTTAPSTKQYSPSKTATR